MVCTRPGAAQVAYSVSYPAEVGKVDANMGWGVGEGRKEAWGDGPAGGKREGDTAPVGGREGKADDG